MFESVLTGFAIGVAFFTLFAILVIIVGVIRDRKDKS